MEHVILLLVTTTSALAYEDTAIDIDMKGMQTVYCTKTINEREQALMSEVQRNGGTWEGQQKGTCGLAIKGTTTELKGLWCCNNEPPRGKQKER